MRWHGNPRAIPSRAHGAHVAPARSRCDRLCHPHSYLESIGGGTMKTLITNIAIAVLGALAAAGVKVPNVDAGTVTEVVGAIATLAAVINQLVHYFRDKPQDPLKDYQVPRALRPKVRDRGF